MPLVLDGQVADPGAERGRARGRRRVRVEPARVDEIGDEPADVGVHAPALVEEHAAVLGNRRLAVEQMLEHGQPGAAGMGALRDLGELQRIAEQDHVAGRGADGDRVGERDLAGLVDHQVVERAVELGAREEPRRARDELNLGIVEPLDLRLVLDPLAVVSRLLVVARLLEPRERLALPLGLVLDRRQQVVDHLVALGRDADAVSVGEEVDDDLGAAPCLAGARRALDEQVASLERPRERRDLGRIDGLDRRATLAAGEPRRLAPENLLERRVASAAVADRLGKAHHRSLLEAVVVGLPGDERPRQRYVAESRAADEPKRPALLVQLDEPARALPRRRIVRPRRRARACAPAPGS